LQPQPQQPQPRLKKHSKRPPQLKPHLIANLNSGKESRGMFFLTSLPPPCHPYQLTMLQS
jgi:hypothetical protein